MNDVFSPPRFLRLCRQQWQEQRRAWGLFALVLAVLLAVVAGMMLSTSGQDVNTSSQVFVYEAGLLLSGYLFAHQALGVWRSREAALVYLMRPASPFEKWLLSALLLLLAYPLLYSAVFAAVFSVAGEAGYRLTLAEWVKHSANAASGSRCAPTPDEFAVFFPLRTVGQSLSPQLALGLVYAGLMAYASAGLVFFRRHAALRTLVLGLGLCLATALVGMWSSGRSGEFLNWWHDSLAHRPEGLPWLAYVLSALFWLGVPALLWVASYRALRERDLS